MGLQITQDQIETVFRAVTRTPSSSTEIGKRSKAKLPYPVLLGALNALIQQGRITKTGQKRGTRYTLPSASKETAKKVVVSKAVKTSEDTNHAEGSFDAKIQPEPMKVPLPSVPSTPVQPGPAGAVQAWIVSDDSLGWTPVDAVAKDISGGFPMEAILTEIRRAIAEGRISRRWRDSVGDLHEKPVQMSYRVIMRG